MSAQPHEWEQLDMGEAHCLTCGANNSNAECKTKPKPQPSVTIQRSKDQEIENLKRLLASISQRLDALKTR